MESPLSKYILFLGGGGFAGAFGLGVVKGLREQGLRDRISAVYGASAGVLNGAHFLTGEEDNYLPLFLDPTMSSLVHPENIIGAFWHSWKYGITHDKKGVDIFDIETKEKIYRSRKTLNMQKLQSQDMPLYASIYNFREDITEHIDVQTAREPYALITASSALAPLWGQTGFFQGKEYLDGSLKEPLPGKYLLNTHPDEKIIVVMNNTLRELEGEFFTNLIEKTLLSWWAQLVLGKNVSMAYAKRHIILRKEYHSLKDNPRVTLITIPEKYSINHFRSTPKKIRNLYDIGYTIGKQVAQSILK